MTFVEVLEEFLQLKKEEEEEKLSRLDSKRLDDLKKALNTFCPGDATQPSGRSGEDWIRQVEDNSISKS